MPSRCACCAGTSTRTSSGAPTCSPAVQSTRWTTVKPPKPCAGAGPMPRPVPSSVSSRGGWPSGWPRCASASRRQECWWHSRGMGALRIGEPCSTPAIPRWPGASPPIVTRSTPGPWDCSTCVAPKTWCWRPTPSATSATGSRPIWPRGATTRASSSPRPRRARWLATTRERPSPPSGSGRLPHWPATPPARWSCCLRPSPT